MLNRVKRLLKVGRRNPHLSQLLALLSDQSVRDQVVCRVVYLPEPSLVWKTWNLSSFFAQPVVDHGGEQLVQSWQRTDWTVVFGVS